MSIPGPVNRDFIPTHPEAFMPPAAVVPTYNEIENIALLIRDLHASAPELHIVVVDDNSPDGTGQLADELAKDDARVHPLHRPAKLGLGTAHIAGMRAALARDFDPILTLDADFSHDPRYVPDLIAGLRQYDVVIGSRYIMGGGTRHCTLSRRALSRSANLFADSLLGLSARDATAGFRAYRRQVLESVPLDSIVSNGYSFLIELLYECREQGWRIGEVPIIFENRRRGASKISKQEIYRALGTVVRLYRRDGHLSPKPIGTRAK